tara:strand:- start:274 stop:486 length:213 start_codon:yes stop_codon:yes gene_type:complete
MKQNTPTIGQHAYFDARIKNDNGGTLSRDVRYIVTTNKTENCGCHYSTIEELDSTPFVTYHGIIKSIRKV